ncbi:MAG: hypothetical protein WBE34_18955 [Candidatus Nitrosopolaris sp.]
MLPGNKENVLAICDYISSLKLEINPSDNYRRDNIVSLCTLHLWILNRKINDDVPIKKETFCVRPGIIAIGEPWLVSCCCCYCVLTILLSMYINDGDMHIIVHANKNNNNMIKRLGNNLVMVMVTSNNNNPPLPNHCHLCYLMNIETY